MTAAVCHMLLEVIILFIILIVYIVLVRDSTAVKRHRDYSNSYKGKHLFGAVLQFRGLIHYYHGAGERAQISTS